MNKDDTRLLRIEGMMLLILIPTLILLLTSDDLVYGQTQGTTTATQPPPPPPPTPQQQQQQQDQGGLDPTVVTAAAGGGVAGVVAIVKSVMDQRTNTKRDKATDGDAGVMFSLLSKYFQAKYLYPKMTDKEVLDLPISNNPLSKMTLGQAITSEADKWVQGNQQYWNIPQPQMSVPTLTTVEAVKSAAVSAATAKPEEAANKKPATS